MQGSHVPSSQIIPLLEDAGSGLRTWLAPAPKTGGVTRGQQ